MFRHRKGFLRHSPAYTRGSMARDAFPLPPNNGTSPSTNGNVADKAALDFKFHQIAQSLDYVDPSAKDDKNVSKDSEHYYDLPLVAGITPQITPSHQRVVPREGGSGESDLTHRTDSSGRSCDSLHTGTG